MAETHRGAKLIKKSVTSNKIIIILADYERGLFQALKDQGIGTVDDGGVEAVEVDAGGVFAVVSKSF